MAIPQISEAELMVMQFLWEHGSATSGIVVESLMKKTQWKPKTIHTLLSRLVGKGAVRAEKIDGKSYLYQPVVTMEEYRIQESRSFLKKMFDGSVNLMVASFIKDKNLSRKELEDLRKLLEEER